MTTGSNDRGVGAVGDDPTPELTDEFGAVFVCEFCGLGPNVHHDSEHGPRTICPPFQGNNWGRRAEYRKDEPWSPARFISPEKRAALLSARNAGGEP